MKSVSGPITGPCQDRALRNDSVAAVCTTIRAGRSDRTHTRPEDVVTSPVWTPQSALGRPLRAWAGAAQESAGSASAAEPAAAPRSSDRRPKPPPDPCAISNLHASTDFTAVLFVSLSGAPQPNGR
ncbi:hypothetical protein Stube_00960 [Streptomyces tubercidicus]|uniref:Uncharacterized protein n=1 Tax=Streptomyces tubercidicus TaxID=47759 RepID=A0A640UH82_9ACTN|nr:hypothetical protein Stube_00960 [Streptomyces tubercidicus]